MLKDYLFPHRLFIMKSLNGQIQEKVNCFIPKEYDPNQIFASCRHNIAVKTYEDMLQRQEVGNGFKDISQIRSRSFSDRYEDNNVKMAGAEAGILYGIDVFHSFLEVDKYVYEGMEKLTNLQFNSISDLSEKVMEYKHDFWHGLSEKGIDKIAGHIGEVHAAEHLHNAGANIEWPDASNQPGWDLLVNGHEVNVKLVSDFHSLSEHFSKYPDIPVVIPGDAANIPANAIHFDASHGLNQIMDAISSHHDHLVFVDDALSNHDVIQHTHNATDTLLVNHDMIHFHVPVVTLVFSGWREVNLLWDNKTDIESAVKNIGLDAAGTGVGGFAGAKTGVLLGGAIGGPIGAAIGSVLGGISGALLGRSATNEIKKAPFKNAGNHYSSCSAKLKKKIEYESEKFNAEFERVKGVEQEKMKNQQLLEQRKIKLSVSSLETWREGQDNLSFDFAVSLLDKSIEEVNECIDEVNRNIHRSGFIAGLFMPTAEDFAYDILIKKLKTLKKSLVRYKVRIKKKNNSTSRKDLYSLIAKCGLQREYIENLIDKSESERIDREKELREHINNSQAKLVEERMKSMKKLSTTLTRLTERMRENVEPYIKEVNEAANNLKMEAHKLGVDM